MGPQGIAEGLHVVVAAKQVQREVQGRQAGASGVQEGGSPGTQVSLQGQAAGVNSAAAWNRGSSRCSSRCREDRQPSEQAQGPQVPAGGARAG